MSSLQCRADHDVLDNPAIGDMPGIKLGKLDLVCPYRDCARTIVLDLGLKGNDNIREVIHGNLLFLSAGSTVLTDVVVVMTDCHVVIVHVAMMPATEAMRIHF